MPSNVTTGGAIRRELKSDRPARASVRVASDAVIAVAASLAAAALFIGVVPMQTQTLMAIVVTASFTVLALILLGAYRRDGGPIQERALRLAAACVLAAAVLGLASLVDGANVFTPQVSVTAVSLAFPLLLFTRLWKPVRRRATKSSDASRTIIVGARDAARAVIRLLDQRDSLPFEVVGCVDDDDAARS